MKNERIQVLDHGYVELIESWGTEERIIEAARMSTNKGFQGWGPFDCPECSTKPVTERIVLYGHPMGVQGCEKCKGKGYVDGDEKLLRYLWDHKHHTPFEMAGMTIEVQAPIFVFREWHRHRTQGHNEMSARYTPLPDVNYIPTVERLLMNSKTNKQAGTVAGADELTEQGAAIYQMQLERMYADQESLYQRALQNGIPKELARIHLPVGRYSRMRATANLRNWLAFLKLRMPNDAQYEIRMFANVVARLIEEKFPRTYALFAEGK